MRWFRGKAEYVVAGGALAAVALMVSWWAVLARRLVHTTIELEQQLHLAKTGTPIDLTDQAFRMNLMVVTEFGAIAISLASAIGALLYVARQRSLANVRMERLLQFTSHELKTPIAGVRALLQTLAMGAVPEARKAEFIERGVQEVDRLEHLAETILAWQRSVASSDRLSPSALDARRLVEQVLEHRAQTGVKETVEVRMLETATVLADSDAFRVILENLLDNARKYGGGTTEVRGTVSGQQWQLSVRDGGAGFPSAEAERLFDPFKRHDHDGVTHGSGLGLFISRQLAKRMQGDLTARSEGPGRGAVFTVTLPVGGAAHG
ncbi:MAG: HAMP domain-containing histidine kinase [Myxococcaceae bacterium]|nr:HAMP domain-containing histidine kinase [Myxococcaceae bacterium]MCA3012452.1 HAMP domain-containing histidine kinase [Myxococcaceae bacterium]